MYAERQAARRPVLASAGKLAAGVFTAWMLGACGGADQPQAEKRPRHAILVSIDTLRADHLGCYGHDRETSPRIDRLAAEGTVFEDACATAPWTLPSHASMLTGLFVRSHGVDGWQKVIPPDLRRLPGELARAGFATGAFVNVNILSRERGFDSGFQTWVPIHKTMSRDGATAQIVDQALAWVKERSGQPFFLFLHLYDVHSDYASLPEFEALFADEYSGTADGSTAQLHEYHAGRLPAWGADDARHLANLYDAGIRQIDSQLDRFWQGLRDAGLWDDTVIVLTSDHGEEFLEHGGVLHGRNLHEEQVHVPLILFGADIPAGRRFRGLVSLVDIMPTTLTLLGVPVPPGLEGIDLTRAWRVPSEWPPERSMFAEADRWYAMKEQTFRRSVRKGSFKLHYDHLTGTKTLFDLASDPLERTDLASQRPDVVQALSAELERFMHGNRELEDSFELSEQELQTLKKLGYF